MTLLDQLDSLEKRIARDDHDAHDLISAIRRDLLKSRRHTAELERYQALLKRTAEIVTHSDIDPVAGNILEALMHVIGATRGFMGIVEPDGWRFLQARNIEHGDLKDPESQISTRIIEETLKTGLVVVADARGTVPSQSVTTLQLKSVACFALDLSGDTGFIYVDNPTRTGLFDRASVDAIRAWLPLLQNQLIRAIESSNREEPSIPGVLTRSDSLNQSLVELNRAAGFDVPVLLWGETGTGKSFIARKLHEASPRQSHPFVHVNCAALPSELAESELFGVKAGAFTGARHDRQGKFEAARGGTLFLDEIDLMPMDMQSKLLIALQNRTITPLGSNREVNVDVRIISAMSADPEDAIHQNRLRRELYYRLATIETHIPPLRERTEDIPLLARNALETARKQFDLPPIHLSRAALNQLLNHPWEGNVRELENSLDRAALLCRDGQINELQLRQPRTTVSGSSRSKTPTRRRYGITEAEFLEQWEAQRGNIDRVAAELRVSRRTVFRLKGKHISTS
jgi:DNA-binding NtrC family response regulator